jgi:hypothetical protein
MTKQAPEPEEAQEPTDAEMEAWLATPDGQAAMREVMQQTLAGKYGEVPEVLMEMSREGLRKHHSHDVMGEVKQRFGVLQEQLRAALRDGPDGSWWQHAREMNEELKAIMDLVLEVHEPYRSKLMPDILEMQQDMEALMKTL